MGREIKRLLFGLAAFVIVISAAPTQVEAFDCTILDSGACANNAACESRCEAACKSPCTAGEWTCLQTNCECHCHGTSCCPGPGGSGRP